VPYRVTRLVTSLLMAVVRWRRGQTSLPAAVPPDPFGGRFLALADQVRFKLVLHAVDDEIAAVADRGPEVDGEQFGDERGCPFLVDRRCTSRRLSLPPVIRRFVQHSASTCSRNAPSDRPAASHSGKVSGSLVQVTASRPCGSRGARARP
jgi:hypothetical protein